MDRCKRLTVSRKDDKTKCREKKGGQEGTRQREARSLAIIDPYNSSVPETVNG